MAGHLMANCAGNISTKIIKIGIPFFE